MKRLLILASVLLLSACAGVQTFDQHIKSLEGHPVNDAAIMLNQKHTGEYKQGDATVYVWQGSYSESVFDRSTYHQTGTGIQIGNMAANGNIFLLSGIQYDSCVIRATTLDGIIQRITFEGNPGGCETVYGWKKHPMGKSAH